ncbi:MAG: S8 family serine peptidase, partial [Actinomycetota bacterium]
MFAALERSPRVRVVVALRPPTPASLSPEARQRKIGQRRQEVLRSVSPANVQPRSLWSSLSGFAGEVTPAGLEELSVLDEVLRIDLDVAGGGHLAESRPLVGADLVWQSGLIGAGTTIAVLDTGIDTDHADLQGALVAEHCFCDRGDGSGCCPNGQLAQDGPGSAEDDNGHGTNVAGIALSDGNVGLVGLAPGAALVGIKVLDNGSRFAFASQVISGLDWILTNHPEVGVVNMSLGTDLAFAGDCDGAAAWTLLWAQAIDTLWQRGVSVIASTGNQGDPTRMQAPACGQHTLSVGAVYDGNLGSVNLLGCSDVTTQADQVTCFSNASGSLDLLAPGALIQASGRGGGTSVYAGTSQAAPHVAGAVAVLREVDPTLSPEQIEILLKSSGALVLDVRNNTSYPRLNLAAAVSAAGAEVCADGRDNDGDTLVDCADPDCTGAVICQPEICADGAANNADALVDCDDTDCTDAL